jgi:hypothetical protein
MRKLAFVPFALLCVGAAAPQASQPAAPPAPDGQASPFDRMNVMRTSRDCVSIPRQVSGEDRRYEGTRLDQQPPGRMILAVERRVNGCPEVTFANELQRSAQPNFLPRK